MAQTGFTPIQLYRTSTASAVPVAGNLAAGELALNTTDEKLYFKNASGVVKLLASNAGAIGDVVGPASATDSALAAFDGTTGKLIKQAATVTVAQGGTGVTTSTGTGSVVLSNSPTLVTPVLGVATGTSFQGIIGNVTPAAGTFTTLTASSTLSLTGSTSGAASFATSTTTGNISIGTSQTTGTLTLGGTTGTGAMTFGRSTGAQTLNFGTGVNTAATKTVNIGTGSTGATGITNITLGPSNAASQAVSAGLLRGRWSTSIALQGQEGFTINNSPTGTYIAPGAVILKAFTSGDDGAGAYTAAYQAGSLGWTDLGEFGGDYASFAIKTDTQGFQYYSFYHNPFVGNIYVGSITTDLTKIYGFSECVALGPNALQTNEATPTISVSNTVAVGTQAGAVIVDPVTTPTITSSGEHVLVGYKAGRIDSLSNWAATYGLGHVCIGYQSGYLTATTNPRAFGDYNVCIGYSAGARFDKGYAGNMILIGFTAGAFLPDNVGDVTVIGGSLAEEAAAATGDVLIGNGNAGLLFNATWNSTAFSSLTLNADNALLLRSTGGLSFYDNELKIVDNGDPTKVLQFETSGITSLTTRTLTVPNASGTIALLSGTQTFSGTTTFSGATFTVSGTTSTLGSGTGAITANVGSGATTTGTTKTINIGTAGVSGSTTSINIGSTVSGATTNLSFSGNMQMLSGVEVKFSPAIALILTTATLTNADIQAQIVQTGGSGGYTVTMPTGSTLETLVPWAGTNLAYDFTVINTSTGTVTIAINTGVTSVGALTVDTNVSAQFRIRRTATNTFVLYRLN